MNEFRKSALNRSEEKYRKKIQGQIQYCSYDQPYEEGTIAWVFGEKTDMNDLFFSFSVPDPYKKKILSRLKCPSCGNTYFDLKTEIGVKSRFEKDVDSHMNDVSSLYGKEVKALEDLLEDFPLLAFQNDFAKRIYKEIKNKKLPLTSLRGSFFRARNVESSEVIGSENMYSAPKGKPSEGRFNHSGQSHLYLANNKITAIKEVATEKRALLVWCQEFEISKKIPDILDLSFDWDHLTPSTSALLLSLKLYKTIERSDRNKGNWKPDYYLTRYIMDCAKSAGYNGIKYNSSKNDKAYNVVLFYLDTLNILPVGHPTVEVFLDKEEESEFSKNLIDH
jgi:hypothetical protein